MPDLRLRMPAHAASFSRNDRFVYCRDHESRLRAWSLCQGRVVVVAPDRGAARSSVASPSEAPLLPSCGETGGPLGGLSEDVAAVRAVLTASDEPTVVVAHSYGGIVAAEAAAGWPCTICCWCPATCRKSGRASRRSAARRPPRSSTSIPTAGRSPSARTPWRRRSCRTAMPEIQRQAAEKTARQSLAVLQAPVRSAAWQHVAEHLPRLRRGPRHARRAPAPVRRAGRHGRRARRRPPPVPVAAGRGPRPGAQLVSPRPMVAIGGAPCPGSTRACGVNPNRSYSATGPPSQTSR